MAKAGKSAVTSNTPKAIVFRAGTIHRGLKIENGSHNGADTMIGATQGGATLNITPEFTAIEADGALVAWVGQKQKTGEKATLKIKALELRKELLVDAVAGETTESTITGHDVIKSKAAITKESYAENIAIIGQTVEGKDCIVILPNALCVNGLELNTEDKTPSVVELEYECHADPDTSDLDVLPWEIHWPTITA